MKFKGTYSLEELTNDYINWSGFHGHGTDRRGTRFGQWICNNNLKPGESFPKLFYIEDARVAYDLAYMELISE
jgi:hypothetical protein